MKVPFIDILRFEAGFYETVTEKTAQLIKNGHFAGGPVVGQFESALKAYTKSAHALGCANGTDALQLALRAAGVAKDDKVVIPDMTFWATFEAVVNVGAIPCTLDVSRETLHLTVAAVEQAIETFKPKALLLVHLYGWACPDTLAIRALCRDRGVILIEDCAQSMGTEIGGESLIGGAAVATTSFYPAKVLGASGDAGGVFFQDEALARDCRILINHGRISHYGHGMIGWNSRLGAYEANFLLESLGHLDARLESRRRVCAQYRERISLPGLSFIAPAADVLENGYLSVAVMDPQSRPAFEAFLKSKDIGYGVVYPGAMSEQPGAAGHIGGRISHGNAQWVAGAVINLPCFAHMRQDEVDYVVDSVNSYH